ncbi:hypothetical protein OF83DRAFT_1088323 [Amylostereum chailletii]|nr:hypothetical protein OF83DRAFT_1088323 [Amylostereum chailletii]
MPRNAHFNDNPVSDVHYIAFTPTSLPGLGRDDSDVDPDDGHSSDHEEPSHAGSPPPERPSSPDPHQSSDSELPSHPLLSIPDAPHVQSDNDSRLLVFEGLLDPIRSSSIRGEGVEAPQSTGGDVRVGSRLVTDSDPDIFIAGSILPQSLYDPEPDSQRTRRRILSGVFHSTRTRRRADTTQRVDNMVAGSSGQDRDHDEDEVSHLGTDEVPAPAPESQGMIEGTYTGDVGSEHLQGSDITRPPTPLGLATFFRGSGVLLSGHDDSVGPDLDLPPSMKPGVSMADYTSSHPQHDQELNGWRIHRLPRYSVYFVHNSMRIVTDVDLGITGALERVQRYLTGITLPPPGWELWLRGICQDESDILAADCAWVNHDRREVSTVFPEGIHNVRARWVRTAPSEAAQMDRSYWSFVEAHPSHVSLPESALEDAKAIIHSSHLGLQRFLDVMIHDLSPLFTQDEYQELMKMLALFSGMDTAIGIYLLILRYHRDQGDPSSRPLRSHHRRHIPPELCVTSVPT